MRGFIDRVTDGVAVILLEGGGRAYVPAARLPEGSAAGALVDVSITPIPSGLGDAEDVAEIIERLRAGEHLHGPHG
jgi:hypothetical protein